MIGLLGFSTELDALREGYVSVVVPMVLALHAVVPIICAPFLFDESRPAGLLPARPSKDPNTLQLLKPRTGRKVSCV